MADTPQPVGSISWADLTVPNAENVRDFYAAVVGWKHSPVDMGSYQDYCMNRPEDGATVAGICHASGVNADLPAQWLIYVTVSDLDESIAQCRARGGHVLAGPRGLEKARVAVIQDPAGACVALFQPGATAD